MSQKPCARCKSAPRKDKDCYCADCRRAYSRESARRTRGCTPRKLPWRPLEEGEKYCPGCDRILVKERFSKSRGKPDGLMSRCKGCDAFKQASYRTKNRKQVRAKSRIRSARFRAANPGYNARACLRYKRSRIAEKMQQAVQP